MAPIKNSNIKPLSSIENTIGQDALQASHRARRVAASSGTENRQAGTQRDGATTPNASTGSVLSSRGARRVAAPPTTSSYAQPGSSDASASSGAFAGPPPSLSARKRRGDKTSSDVASRQGNGQHHGSVASSRIGGTTRYVPDYASSQPPTSTAPPQKVYRSAFLNAVFFGAPTKITTVAANGTKHSKLACCTEQVDKKFSSFRRFCAESCDIEIGDKYFMHPNGEVLCSDCFNEKVEGMKEKKEKEKKEKEENEQKGQNKGKPFNEAMWKKLKNVNISKEQTLECKKCHAKWHQCCSLDLQHKPFTCSSCTTKRTYPIRTTLHEHSNNKFESFMEERLNSLLKKRLDAEEQLNRLSVVSFKEKKEVPMKDVVPRPLREAFAEKYEQSIKYDVRSIYLFQRLGDVDVLVFAMSCQEYKNILGRSWVVIDYLDSVPFVQPAKVRGTVFREAILLYLDWAKQIGFNHAHFFSNPPEQGTDFIFSIHPKNQVYRNDEDLLEWYNRLLDKGVAEGILKEVRTFEQEMERKPYTCPTDLLPFHGGLWMNCMNEFDNDICKDFGRTLTKEEYFEKFAEKMKEKFETNAENNFFIDLNLTARRIHDPDQSRSHKVLGDRDAFLEKCRKNNWEFSSLRRAKYTSVAVITMVMGELGAGS